jgi:nudix-type nucleoside diphosphatase (YffH/AdpP family)
LFKNNQNKSKTIMVSIKNIKTEVLSDNWYTLRKITFEHQMKNGEWVTQSREAYDRGNGAVILLYNPKQKTIVLTQQFRMPTFLNGNPSGMMIEACAGLLDLDNPEDCIKRETEEETGYKINKVKKVYEVYMSPGSVTEILYFFIAEYSKDLRVHQGGGVDNENIEVLEINFFDAIEMVKTGEIKDAKTIMLLQHAYIEGLFDSQNSQ